MYIVEHITSCYILVSFNRYLYLLSFKTDLELLCRNAVNKSLLLLLLLLLLFYIPNIIHT